MTDLITRIEDGNETYEDRIAVSERLSEPGEPSPVHAPFENVQVVIDAVERLLPGSNVFISKLASHNTMTAIEVSGRRGGWFLSYATTPARALLSALLKALDRDDD